MSPVVPGAARAGSMVVVAVRGRGKSFMICSSLQKQPLFGCINSKMRTAPCEHITITFVF